MKDKIQCALTLAFGFGYLILVFTGKANVEGFCILATYIVKKALDLIEANGKEIPNG